MQNSGKTILSSSLSAYLLLSNPAYASEPMLDGQCDEHDGQAVLIGQGVSMVVTQTVQNVWLCIAVPEHSYGVVDLQIEAPQLPYALNLHASAQLGEWAAQRPEAAPTGPESSIWGNNHGWIANVTTFAGLNVSVSPPRARFRTVKGREFQLSKKRFGKGSWRIRLVMQAIARPDGSMIDLSFPEKTGQTYLLNVI